MLWGVAVAGAWAGGGGAVHVPAVSGDVCVGACVARGGEAGTGCREARHQAAAAAARGWTVGAPQDAMTEPWRQMEPGGRWSDVERGALLAVLEKLVASQQALHDRFDTLERALKARGSL